MEELKVKFLAKYMTRAETFIKKAKRKHGHRSTMTYSAWCDLNKKCTVLRLPDMCPNSQCICQKQITFSRGYFQMEGGSKKSKLPKIKRHKVLGLNF